MVEAKRHVLAKLVLSLCTCYHDNLLVRFRIGRNLATSQPQPLHNYAYGGSPQATLERLSLAREWQLVPFTLRPSKNSGNHF